MIITGIRLQVVSNFGERDLWGGQNTHARVWNFEETRCALGVVILRARVYFARPTIATAKIKTTPSLHWNRAQKINMFG